MALTIFDLFNSEELTTYWDTLARERPPYLLESRFPARKQLGLDTSWLTGSNGVPKVLNLSAFDVQVVPRNRIGFSTMSAEMPFFKESMYIDEKLRQELNKVIATGNQAYIDVVMNRVFDDTTQLLEAAAVVRERMRAELLTTGSLYLESNGQVYEYDYDMDSDQKPTVSKSWSDESAPIIDEVREWQDMIEDNTGVRPTDVIVSRKTWNYLLKNTDIRNGALGNNSAAPISDGQVNTYLMNMLGLSVTIYNKKYKNEDGDIVPFIPDDTFILLPSGKLGNTVYGTTPEESDLQSGNAASSVSITDTGVAVTTMERADPVNVETKVSMICLPTFEMVNQVVIADVIA